MKLGVYTAILHDRDLPEALDALVELGLNGAEINSGGFLPPRHLPIDAVMSSDSARDDYLGLFAERNIKLTALNCNGNPLHPDPEVGLVQGQDVFTSISVAHRLGVKRVITMSGLPAAHDGGLRPAWAVNPWNSVDMDTLDYQWHDVVIPYWRRVNEFAAAHDVKVAIEMHPQNVVFNPSTLVRLVDAIDATHVGAEMDPSHLFWQQIDPIKAMEYLGELVYCAAAKDIRINEAVSIHGVLDDRFRRVPAAEYPLSLGGKYTLCEWPKDSAWDFVAVGLGHDQDFWNRFVATLARVAPETDLAIEHEDASLDRLEGLRVAVDTLSVAFAGVPIAEQRGAR
ncbi:sugar phosphate isomerase/epimerase [Cryobacterium sp. M91]|uniref:sugar phosphate isomerase/epimerase family protein n=1 Tax=Cryobacterium sp. M91 TaxID=2048294 RepID=UPI000CE57652|nr:sugar phosphate isomerase/epimerase [Cryobacterium sp. M91]